MGFVIATRIATLPTVATGGLLQALVHGGLLKRAIVLLLAVGIPLQGAQAADDCAACIAKCEETVTTPCAEQATEVTDFVACLAARQSCRSRCTCPSEDRVKACESDTRKLATSREASCRVQFAENPTNCLDQTRSAMKDALSNCRR